MKISLIVAVADNGVIGKNNDLIWYLPRDLKFFKNTTTGHHILMGKNTFHSLPKVLPNRKHIVVSSSLEFKHEQVVIVKSVEEGIAQAEVSNETDLYIIGGGRIYNYCLENNLVDCIYLTRVHESFDGDVFFPTLHEAKWNTIKSDFFAKDENNEFDSTFVILERK